MVCVSASDVSRNTYNLLGFLLPWTWGICLGLLKQSAATAPYLGAWYLLTATLPDLERGVSPLHAPVPAQPLLLGCGVTPLGCHPGPRAWGSSSWPLPVGHGVLTASAPDLGRGVAPLGPACVPSQPPAIVCCHSLYFLGSKITADGDCSHEIKRCLLLGRNVMTNLDNILKNRDITLLTKILSSQGYGFSCSHVWMRELDYKES